MESIPLTQKELAQKLGLSKGRISQILNDPGNLTLKKIVEYSRALGIKVAIVAYEDDDSENKKGPISSEIFRICWEKAEKPRDFWAFEQKRDQMIQSFATVPIANAINKFVTRSDIRIEKVDTTKPAVQSGIETTPSPIVKIA
jgi:transcriptional regulator with XRE-family HTH domain